MDSETGDARNSACTDLLFGLRSGRAAWSSRTACVTKPRSSFCRRSARLSRPRSQLETFSTCYAARKWIQISGRTAFANPVHSIGVTGVGRCIPIAGRGNICTTIHPNHSELPTASGARPRTRACPTSDFRQPSRAAGLQPQTASNDQAPRQRTSQITILSNRKFDLDKTDISDIIPAWKIFIPV